MKKRVFILCILVLLLGSAAVYGLFRFEWNNYGFGKTHSLQEITGAIQLGGTVMITTANPYLFISDDQGVSWRLELFNLGEKEENFTDLSKDDNLVYFISRSNYGGNISPRFLYKSTSKGRRWEKIDLAEVMPEVNGLSIESFAIRKGRIQFLDENRNSYYQSSDFGANWTESNTSILKDTLGKRDRLVVETTNNEILIKEWSQGEVIAIVRQEFNLSLMGKVTFNN